MSKFYDTLIWEYISRPWDRWMWLDKLSQVYFDYAMISYDEVTSKWKIPFEDLDLQIASVYSSEDVYITAKLYEKQKKEFSWELGILDEIEFPLLEVLEEIELNWVKVDSDRLKWIWILLENELRVLEKDIYNDADEEFNISSPKQVWEMLFWKLALPKWKKTKTGYSVSAEVLWELAFQYPIAQKIVDYRRYSKLLSTYINWLLDLLNESSDNLIHTSYNQTVTTTWRLSSTNPNLQNIPVWDGISWEIRTAFISRFKGWKILAFDYSQIEVRLLAIMSGDDNLINSFKSWLDIHHRTAEFIFQTSDISSSQRKIAKAVNFWVIYGISGFWLSKMLWISLKDAKLYIDKFFLNYPKVKSYLENTIKFCEQNWYVETLFWRRRYIKSINDKNSIIKNAAEREAINMPIQWTAADIIKLAMIKVSGFLKENNLKSKMIMQVHDELVFDTFPWEEDILEVWIKNIMENIISSDKLKIDEEKIVKLIVDVWVWKNWGEAK